MKQGCSFDLNHALTFILYFPHLLKNRFALEKILVIEQPLSPDDTFLINDEEPPSRNQSLGLLMRLNSGVIPDDVQLRMIAQERVRQLQGIGECLLGKWVVCANPKNLDVQLLELLIVDLPGRQVLRSRGTEIVDVKLEENILLPSELAQADLFTVRAWKREIRRLVTDLHRSGHESYSQQCSQQRTQQQQASNPSYDHTHPSISFL
jgi:hypothetical protein